MVVGITSNTSDQANSLVEALLLNPRASIRQISSQLNLKYNYVRRLLRKLFSRKHLVPVLALSSSIFGREAAIIRIKSSNPSSIEKISDLALHCNRVISYVEISNGREAMVIVVGESKQKTIKLIELIRSIVNDVVEISAEYGILPRGTLVLVKNTCSKCNYSSTCGNNSKFTFPVNNRNHYSSL